jgi:hypothetical protein
VDEAAVMEITRGGQGGRREKRLFAIDLSV